MTLMETTRINLTTGITLKVARAARATPRRSSSCTAFPNRTAPGATSRLHWPTTIA